MLCFIDHFPLPLSPFLRFSLLPLFPSYFSCQTNGSKPDKDKNKSLSKISWFLRITQHIHTHLRTELGYLAKLCRGNGVHIHTYTYVVRIPVRMPRPVLVDLQTITGSNPAAVIITITIASGFDQKKKKRRKREPDRARAKPPAYTEYQFDFSVSTVSEVHSSPFLGPGIVLQVSRTSGRRFTRRRCACACVGVQTVKSRSR